MTLSRRTLLAAGSAAFANAGWAAQPELASFIDKRREGLKAAMSEHDIPGAAVVLIHKGKVAWIEGFGMTDKASGKPIDTETIFSIQSTSKNMTATAIMLAVQKGILDLDAPISTYYPDFTVHSRFGTDPQKKMTLRLLLSHRGGFTHEAPLGNNYRPAFDNFESHVHSISDTWLRYPVGERYSYSNLGIDLAGFILQRATGVPFWDYIKTVLFDPLGMTNSTFATDVYVASANRAIGHQDGYEKVPVEIPLIPSGGCYTCAKDMARYLQFHLDKGAPLLDRKLWDEMHGFPYGGGYSLGIAGGPQKYGSTVVRRFNHDGGGFGFGCVFTHFPDNDLAWATLLNRPVAHSYPDAGDGITEDILTEAHGKRVPMKPAKDIRTTAVPRHVLDKYVGKYALRGNMAEIGFDGEDLGFRLGKQSAKINFTSPTKAFIADPMGEARMFDFLGSHHGEAARVAWPDGPSDLDYNDGPNDAPGPNKPEWKDYAGNYEMLLWQGPTRKVVVQIRNGYLYVGDKKLIAEYAKGLFFTSDGEALDFRHEPPTLASIPLSKA